MNEQAQDLDQMEDVPTIHLIRRSKEGAGYYFPNSKVKYIMQLNEDIGKVGSEAIQYLSSVCLKFSTELLNAARDEAKEDQRLIIKKEDIEHVLSTKPQFQKLWLHMQEAE